MHRKLLSSLIIGSLLAVASLGLREDREIVAQQGPDASNEEPIRAAAPIQTITPRSVRAAVAAAPAPRKRTFLPAIDHPDIKEEHKIIADEVLRLLPERCLHTLKNFYVRYEPMGSRGYAGENTVILSGLVPDAEFRALLIHETFGHVMDLGCLKGSARSGKSEFKDGPVPIYRNDPSVAFYRISWTSEKTRKKSARESDFVSGYAYKADAFEDLAESVTYYVLHYDTFAARAKTNAALAEKLRWIETFVFTRPLRVASSEVTNTEIIPWDTTKLPYAWKPEVVAKK